MPEPFEIKVLIAHSDPLISAGLRATLGKRRELTVVVCNPESTVWRSAACHRSSCDVVVADYDSGLRLTALKGAWRGSSSHDSYALRGCGLDELIQGIRSIHNGGIALDALVASRVAGCMKQEALTRREKDILGQIMLGLSKSIASNLTVAVGTVKTHVKSIL
jgi:DNA-binding NarL/FixJ family response regulator